jgi:hypothetical protein
MLHQHKLQKQQKLLKYRKQQQPAAKQQKQHSSLWKQCKLTPQPP